MVFDSVDIERSYFTVCPFPFDLTCTRFDDIAVLVLAHTRSHKLRHQRVLTWRGTFHSMQRITLEFTTPYSRC